MREPTKEKGKSTKLPPQIRLDFFVSSFVSYFLLPSLKKYVCWVDMPSFVSLISLFR